MQKSELFKMLKHVANHSFISGVIIEIDTDSLHEDNNDVYLIKNGRAAVLKVLYDPCGNYVGFEILDSVQPISSVTVSDIMANSNTVNAQGKFLWLHTTTWEDAFRALHDPRKRLQKDAINNIVVIQEMIERMVKERLKMNDVCSQPEYSAFHAKVRATISSKRAYQEISNGNRKKGLKKGRPTKINPEANSINSEVNESNAPFQ